MQKNSSDHYLPNNKFALCLNFSLPENISNVWECIKITEVFQKVMSSLEHNSISISNFSLVQALGMGNGRVLFLISSNLGYNQDILQQADATLQSSLN